MRGFAFVLLVLAVIAALIQGCARPNDGGAVRIKGSDTMVNLNQAWAEAYQKENPDANVSVTGGGSGTGIAALINGDVDIAASSRDISEQEMSQARERGLNPQEFEVATDGVSVIVNPDNPVSRLTVRQIADIYTGEITNWNQLGGPDRKIVALSRDRSSGTHVFFLEEVLRGGDSDGEEEFAPSVLMLPSSQAIADEVANNEAAIGYVGVGYVNEQQHKALAVAESAQSSYIAPTVESIQSGDYPIARPLYYYTPNTPTEQVRSFIDFVLSPEGQKIVQQQDFVPVK